MEGFTPVSAAQKFSGTNMYVNIGVAEHRAVGLGAFERLAAEIALGFGEGFAICCRFKNEGFVGGGATGCNGLDFTGIVNR